MALKFLKFIIGLALAPFVAGEVWTLIDLAKAAIPAGEWHAAWFVSFAAGFAAWLFIFIFLPRTLWLYVLGHEFTHALAAMMAGGKVMAFKVSSKGGHVMTDKVNWWIALSPYFVPIYALIWMALWLTIDFYHSLRGYLPILYFGIGLFWAFHLTFTVSVLHRQQTDISREGFVFAGVIIALTNLLTVLLLFALLVHQFGYAGHLFLGRVGQAYVWTGREIMQGFAWAQAEWARRS
jgi:hypothetical protein